jgi:hypothetical protein
MIRTNSRVCPIHQVTLTCFSCRQALAGAGRSDAKAKASRANGSKGGRPKRKRDIPETFQKS